METKTQIEMLIDYLGDGNSITSLEAIQMFGITRLAARIEEIGKEILIKKKWVQVPNRYGRMVPAIEYSF